GEGRRHRGAGRVRVWSDPGWLQRHPGRRRDRDLRVAGEAAAVMRYALLIAPSSNRVYAGEAPRLTEAELAVFGEAVLGARPRNLGVEQLGGVPYVVFEVDSPLTDRDIAYLSNVSTAYALFAREGDLLRPVPLTPLARYDDDLLTILKYPGKTNEQFTQLELSVAVLDSGWVDQMLERRLVVMDQRCGRGTTPNQAMRYGYYA